MDEPRLHIRKRTILQVVTIGALLVAALMGSWLTHGVVKDDLRRQRVEAARRLSLEIDSRIHKVLAAEEGVYGLSNGQPTFSREQFAPFGRELIRRFGLSYVGWAPAVDPGVRGAFEQQHGLQIEGSRTTEDGALVPLLYSAGSEPQEPRRIHPGRNLLSSPDIGPALVASAQTRDPSVSGNARVDGVAGVVLVQPMFGFDEGGEAMVGWVVAGVTADRLVADSAAFLSRRADVRVVVKERTVYGRSSGAVDPEVVVSLPVGKSTWKISVSGVGDGFSRLAPWLVLAIGLALTTLVAILLWQAAQLDRVRRLDLERLEEAALVDSLTGLRNHRAFQEDLSIELERLGRAGSQLSLVMLDVEGLKAVNDTLGHQEGDRRLGAVADALRTVTRGSDALYRLGGDEFTVLLPETNAWGAFQFVQRVRAELGAGSAGGRAAVAAGVADTLGLDSKDALIRRAALALAESKRSHGAAVIYSAELEPGLREPDDVRDEQYNRILASALARAVDAKDSGTRSHCETVSQLCVMIGEHLGLPPGRIAQLRLAGLLHDVGKIGVPDAILQKPAKLTHQEFEVMKTHSALGHSIVAAAGRQEEAFWILRHHERPDGRGYPAGVHGDELPLEARIILVADAFEAITSDRPYRSAASPAEAIAELEHHAGTQFDPRCVAALKAAIASRAPVPSASLAAVALDAA